MTRRSMPRARRGVRALLVATVVGLASLSTGCGLLSDGAYDLPLPGGPDVGDHPDTIKVEFASVEGLVPKSMVKMNNVAIGQIEDIDVDPATWHAVVTCEVRGDLDLPANVRARVRSSSLLGEWYIELQRPERPAARQLDDGDVVPVRDTSGSAPVEEVLGALSLLLNDGGLPKLHTIVSELNKALVGNEPEIKSVLGDLDELTTSLDANRDDIVRALEGLDGLSRTLNDNKQQIDRALDELPDGVRALADQRPALVRMLKALDRLSDVTTRVVRASKDDTVADLQALRPVLAKLEEAGTDLPDSLELLLTFPFTPGSLYAIRGDYVNLDAKVNLDLGSVLAGFLNSNQPIYLGGQLLPNPLAILGLGDEPAPSGQQSTTDKGAGGRAGDGSGKKPGDGRGSGKDPGKNPGRNNSGSGNGSGGLMGLLGALLGDHR